MSRLRQTPVISMRALILLALLAIVHGHVFAQDGSSGVPENARAKDYGKGWECNQGLSSGQRDLCSRQGSLQMHT